MAGYFLDSLMCDLDLGLRCNSGIIKCSNTLKKIVSFQYHILKISLEFMFINLSVYLKKTKFILLIIFSENLFHSFHFIC